MQHVENQYYNTEVWVLLTYLDCSKLKGKEWRMLEVRSEKTIEPTLRRIGKAVPSIFRENPMEIFIPVGKRDLDTFDLQASTYLFVRSDYDAGLLRLKTITGVVSLVTEGDCNRPSKVIKVPDSDVQRIMKIAETQFWAHSKGIEVGSFVRVLSGETRDFCGIVTAIGNDRAVVEIALKTKSIILETPLANLLNLSHVPSELRTYYHCQLMTNLREDEGREGEAALRGIQEDIDREEREVMEDPSSSEDGTATFALKRILAARRASDIKEALALIRDDSRPEEETSPPVSAKETLKPRTFRQRTVTALVKKLILIDGVHLPMDLAQRVVDAIKAKEVKTPKNFFIIYTIIKDSLMEHWVRKGIPETVSLTSYRDVVKYYGEGYRFSAKQIAALDPKLRIPLGSK